MRLEIPIAIELSLLSENIRFNQELKKQRYRREDKIRTLDRTGNTGMKEMNIVLGQDYGVINYNSSERIFVSMIIGK